MSHWEVRSLAAQAVSGSAEGGKVVLLFTRGRDIANLRGPSTGRVGMVGIERWVRTKSESTKILTASGPTSTDCK